MSPDFPKPPDAGLWQRRELPDTGQHCYCSSCTTRVSICGPKRSASDSADNPRAAKAVDLSTNDANTSAPASTPFAAIQPTDTSQRRTIFDPGWLASFISDSSGSEPSDFERTASDSTDNPSAPTNRSASDERYDERIARGEGDGWTGISSRVEGRVSISQLGGEPSGCKA